MVERVEGLVGLAPGARSGGDLLPGEAGLAILHASSRKYELNSPPL